MARPRGRSGLSISLFPFMSVLLCAMGVLIVIISAQNILAVGTADLVIELVGTEREREPVYVECARDGLVILPERVEVPLAMLRRDADSEFATLLDDLELSEGRKYLVLLIRPEGIESYERAITLATTVWRNVEVGKDALPLGSGRVILTSRGEPAVTRQRRAEQP